MKREGFAFLAFAGWACVQFTAAPAALAGPHDALIAKHAAANGVPEELVRRVIHIESRGNARVVHAGNYGLMQIRLGTARGVGYSGGADGLLDPYTNLTYAVRYLAGAYRAAGCDANRAVRLYQRGYYGAAKRECGAATSAEIQLAQADTKTQAKVRRGRSSLQAEAEPTVIAPTDVIKPKVVRTETISTKSQTAPVRPAGKFEPARIAPPVDAAKIELASVPLPRVRPDLDSVVKQAVHPAQPPEHKKTSKKVAARAKTDSKSKTDANAKAESSFKLADPAEVVSYLKKLVTPDKKPRKRSAEPETEAFAVPPSQAQPLE
jgi:hypothetical protein